MATAAKRAAMTIAGVLNWRMEIAPEDGWFRAPAAAATGAPAFGTPPDAVVAAGAVLVLN